MRVITEVTGETQGLVPVEVLDGIPGALGPVAEEVFRFLCPEWNSSGDLFLSVHFIDEGEMSELNRRFMGEGHPTDVLSFPIHASSGGFCCPTSLPECLLGDIMVCLPRVLENALEAGHPPVRELALVLVHGLLHLLGWDHETEEGRREMWDIQGHFLERVERCLTPPEEGAGPGA
ncbi:MAG: rRNA maturation RNase YbeY [Thermovirgaceae bacterium]|nr:rRNA maturation RNase YbeY [Synergistales bacterium]HPC75790.1 rRNA maturation RNase YbeY [Synergistales bacterium]HRS48543.1 rRNA maturation RNase YbeY [Thermovirgaceae bacterium]HRU90694.1 rRNA maturation RNase YbeY [Thermovirgaceae bacterium]